jgi:N-ethylmaleimide reductase
MQDADAEEFYPFIIRQLNTRNLAYLHIGFEETPAAKINWHRKLRPLYRGVYLANGGFTKEAGEQLLAGGGADAIVYGKLFLANPDLPERFKRGAPLNRPDQTTFYAQGERGYTDYPTLERASAT